MFTINSGGNDESLKSGRREVLVGGSVRRDNRFVFWSVVVSEGLVSGQRRRGINPSNEPPGRGWRRTLAVAVTETEEKREAGTNGEDEERIKRIKDKVDAIPVHSRVHSRPNPAKILYARYVCSLCLCFVGFLCARVSFKI